MTVSGEAAIRACVRACRNAGGYLARLGDAAFQAIERTATSPAFAPCSPQLVLWALDAEALPLRPWRVGANFRFRCVALGCHVTAQECVRRQATTDAQRTKQVSRGRGAKYASCDSMTCAQGRGVRGALDPHVSVAAENWRRAEHYRPGELAAKGRLRATGGLDEVPILDVDAGPVEE